MLPRLNTASRPGGTAAEMLQEKWFQEMAESAENLCWNTALLGTKSYMENWQGQKS